MPHGPEMTLEKNLLNFIKTSVSKNASIRGSPSKVLGLFDEYIRQSQMRMNIGKFKGDKIAGLMRESQPRYMIELGGYMGYSAIKFAPELVGTNAKYFSFEVNPDYANIASQIIEIAGISSKVEIIVGPASETLVKFNENLKEHKVNGRIDFFFIDHLKDLYLYDFRLLESLCLISKGSTIVADNIFMKDTIPYVNYVKSSPEERKEIINNLRSPYANIHQGSWNILYDSKTVETVDPDTSRKDAIEISKCVEVLNS